MPRTQKWTGTTNSMEPAGVAEPSRVGQKVLDSQAARRRRILRLAVAKLIVQHPEWTTEKVDSIAKYLYQKPELAQVIADMKLSTDDTFIILM